MDIAKIRKKRKQQKKKVKKKSKAKKGTPIAEEVLPDAAGEGAEVVSDEITEAQAAATGDVAGEQPGDIGDSAIGIDEQGADEAIETEEVQLIEFLVFRLSDEYYAFNLSDLHEVMKDQFVTLVPKMPGFILGVTSLRGKIIPVMNLNERLSIKSGDKDSKKQIAIIKGDKGPIGMVIDRVIGVRRVDEKEIKEPPSHLDDEQVRYLESVVRDGNKFISILNLSEVLNFEPLLL